MSIPHLSDPRLKIQIAIETDFILKIVGMPPQSGLRSRPWMPRLKHTEIVAHQLYTSLHYIAAYTRRNWRNPGENRFSTSVETHETF